MTLVQSRPPDAGSALPASAPAQTRIRWPAGWRPHGLALVFWLLVTAILVLPIAFFLLAAITPRLFGQGDAWLSVQGFRDAFTSTFLRGTLNSLAVGVAAGLAATAIGGGVAWLVTRTSVIARPLWAAIMFTLLLAPSYLIALGWERLFEPAGVFDLAGLPSAVVRHLLYGPVGVIVVLTVKGLPFAYLAVSIALRGLGGEYEAAARVHGGGKLALTRLLAALLAPAVWSAFTIVFAESVSDFGVAATLANDAHFPIATFTLYRAIDSFPVNFAAAAAVGWVLVGLVGLALLAQTRVMRGRSYRVLGGRSRPARRHHLSPAAHLGAVAFLSAVALIGLGVPVFGAVSASMIDGLGSLRGDHHLTFANFSRVLHSPELSGPLTFSAEMAVATATLTAVLGFIAARMLVSQRSRLAGRLLDLVLLAAVALPGIVFAAGYIFTYNLHVINMLGIHLYGTTTLLLLGYLATALPATSRVLFGTVSQLQDSLHQAARVHGHGALGSWAGTVLPVVARPLIAAWVLTFAATLLELPVSQLLYPPGKPPVAIGITKALANYDYGGGTAMEVLAIGLALVVVGAAWALFALAAPRGWRRIGVARDQ